MKNTKQAKVPRLYPIGGAGNAVVQWEMYVIYQWVSVINKVHAVEAQWGLSGRQSTLPAETQWGVSYQCWQPSLQEELVEGQNLITEVSNHSRIINFMSFCLNILNTILDNMDATTSHGKDSRSHKERKISLWKDPRSHFGIFIRSNFQLERISICSWRNIDLFMVRNSICTWWLTWVEPC